uniref:Uncharacterized protein n=1 Tax=Anguilla anguilla TaxID=7936 RepID=A0A0E9PI21_ANGAN
MNEIERHFVAIKKTLIVT